MCYSIIASTTQTNMLNVIWQSRKWKIGGLRQRVHAAVFDVKYWREVFANWETLGRREGSIKGFVIGGHHPK